MKLLQDIMGLSAEVDQANFNKQIEESFEQTFDKCLKLVVDQNESLDESVATDICTTMAKDKDDEIARLAESDEDDEDSLRARITRTSLAESVDPAFQADVQLLESVTDLTIVGVYDIISEDFQAAVDRILKSGRKLRMTSKDGKTKYKTRRRAAEACAAASFSASFGRKGVNAKAKAGKKG